MSKKFYWLKIQEHFFEDDNIIYLESLENGEKYIIFWQKLLLKCLKNKESGDYCHLRFSEKIPYSDELLSNITRTDIDTVRVAIKFFIELQMIEILEDGTIYIQELNKLIGSETDKAEMMRKHREKIKQIDLSNNVTKMLPYKEIDKEIEIDKKEDIEDSITVTLHNIINYLNKRTNKNFRYTNNSNNKHIKARLNEGFIFDDFKKVIDIKCFQWLQNKEMNRYLRPVTLFGTKFESYLNEEEIKDNIESPEEKRKRIIAENPGMDKTILNNILKSKGLF